MRGNRFEKVDREGIYSLRMFPSANGGFDIAGRRYQIAWENRPENLNEIPRHLRLKMFGEPIVAGNEFFDKYAKHPEVIFVSALVGSDLVRTVAE